MEKTAITIVVVVSITILVGSVYGIVQIKKASALVTGGSACTTAQCEAESQKAMQELDGLCKDLKTKDVNSTAYAELSQKLGSRGCP